MKIQAQILVNEEGIMDAAKTECAAGWVEVEDCIKFPVKIRKYIDKTDKKEKMFISYPQRKSKNGYDNIVMPDKSIRAEMDEIIFDAFKQNLLKGVHIPPITDVKVTLNKNVRDLPVKLRAIASINLAGIQINGITVKEGKNGVFVQMPQYRAGEQYKDIVYGTSSSMQNGIKREVLSAYQELLDQNLKQEEEQKQEQKPEPEQKVAQEQKAEPVQEQQTEPVQEVAQEQQTEPVQNVEQVANEVTQLLSKEESMNFFMAAYESGDPEGMLAVLKNSSLEVEKASLYQDGSIKQQFASILSKNEEDMLTLCYRRDAKSEKIEAYLVNNGKTIGMQELYHVNHTEGAKHAAEQVWRNLTHQKESVKTRKMEQPQTHKL